MGMWSTSINGNDTAKDLLMEYQVAFFQYEPSLAVKRLDEYVSSLFPIQDEEWENYIFSLALFMCQHGIVVDSLIERALLLISQVCSRVSCNKLQSKRRTALLGLRETLLHPPKAFKPIKLNINTEPIFCKGDVISIRLDTQTPQTQKSSIAKIATKYNGHYAMMQKVGDMVSWQSKIDPSFRDIWPIFQLFDFLSTDVPARDSYLCAKRLQCFFADGKKSIYKRKNASVIFNGKEYIPIDNCDDYIFFSQKMDWKIIKLLFEKN